jgi:hypothetical protein
LTTASFYRPRPILFAQRKIVKSIAGEGEKQEKADNPFVVKLKYLESLGFEDRKKNIEILVVTGANVLAAVQLLLPESLRKTCK